MRALVFAALLSLGWLGSRVLACLLRAVSAKHALDPGSRRALFVASRIRLDQVAGLCTPVIELFRPGSPA